MCHKQKRAYFMKAMILDENLNFLWTDVPDPVRKDNEVLIEVHA